MDTIKNFINRLKEYQVISLIIAICYFAGYFSYSYHYRILGLGNVSAGPLEYLTSGGDFFISSIIKTIKVPFDNPKSFLFDLFFGEFKFSTWIIIFILLLQILKLKWGKVLLWVEQTTTFLMIGFLLVFNIMLIEWQSANLQIDDILTVQPQRIYLEFRDKGDRTPCELMEETYRQHLIFLERQSPRTFKRINRWFNMLSTEDLSKNRLISYSNLCFLFILGNIVLLTIIRRDFKKRFFWSTLSILVIIINSIFLPISYGILGTSYKVPYSKINFKISTDSIPNRVYILKEEDDKYIVYDKMNFFQIKYIPKTDVKEVDQLFVLTPFQSPFKDQYSLCDSLLIIPPKIDY